VAGSHPVLDVIRARAVAGSQPSARADGHRVALVLEGGGMRGVVSAAMAAALEGLGLTRCFDVVAGASAGAINGAALLAGVARGCAASYPGALVGREFIDPRRLVLGRRPAVDVAWALALGSEDLDAGRHTRALGSPIALHCVATDVDTAAPASLTGMTSPEALSAALEASCRIPWLGGAPVEFAGRRYLDGGMSEPIPVATAVAAGATHVLALQTRPLGVPRSSGSPVFDRLVVRHLRRLNPALVTQYRERAAAYEALVAGIAAQSAQPDGGPPWLYGLRAPAGTPVVGQLERRVDVLRAAAAGAEALVEDALGG